MGDRGSVQIIPSDTTEYSVYLYTHWRGQELAQTVHRALARKQRWTDDSYLTRIIFCEMLRDGYNDPIEAFDTPESYGISAYPTESEYPDLVVDCAKQQVRVANFKKSFEEFVKDPQLLLKAYLGQR